ncbi:MAG: UDP-N-acetylglucosamine diphosphorylase/glucosamine-1-phosphate N-acetyltransferase [Betaproteobacteria bacterium RIFCSPHIGHO2_12_FULL_69_13]|nr:MAG: UDP-N-acetylglucosamine diphosphorylase/glucosamine-1-phosphate N-acetyltransferase [Betaproteobacteria bacterium RIFCSPHIGHO2_12_FULL_69_13]OGA68432.1 MAG: UDP-N-acetylglucosamine diphosphorylase/glucosamine-1-phosphate N-acetyltransferase [Betaproteobacteria bacterium RIFCSPLOWO2_12_FULL_68_20]
MPLEVIVLAAGLGKRMRSDTPKVLHRLAGRPLLAHVLEAARSLKARRTLVVYGHGGEAVRSAFNRAPVRWVEQAERLGTGHALAQALPQVAPGSDVLVLSGDVPLARAQTLRRLADAAGKGLAILTSERSEPTGYGRVVRDARGRVRRIVEEKDASAKERRIREWYCGFLAAKAKPLADWLAKVKRDNAQKEYYLTDVIGIAAAAGATVSAVKVSDPWEVAGVNSKGELAALEREWQRREAARLLESGVTLADPARLDVRGTLECGRDVSIDVNCVFEGRVALGDGVRIGPNCVLRNVSVAAGSEVHAFSQLEDAEVGSRCRIGPYARLRPGASLADEVHIGNFVEVKASRLGAGSKANHLSYIGDSEVGERVNIGAGTITCNYDGAQKHRTVIEDDCFIGSDATLVAPVRIARGSYIGAGSTISEDTPPGQLTVARAKQVSLPSWKPPRKR